MFSFFDSSSFSLRNFIGLPYRNEIIERIKDWFKTADDVKKKDWKKNMKKDVKDLWSDYDLGILTRIKRSEFTI